jgi:spore coat protein A, manganese oxidase
MKRRSFLQLSSGAAVVFAFDDPLLRHPAEPPILGGSRICRGDGGRVIKASAKTGQAQTPLPGSSIPKYVDPLPIFAGERVTAADVAVSISEFQQQILPASVYAGLAAPFDKGTFVWGYKVGDRPANYPGFTIETQRSTPTTVTYHNDLPLSPFLQGYLTVDQTVHWADPLAAMGALSPYAGPPPVVTHLHGGEVPSAFDGHPDAWFTPGLAMKGRGFASNVYSYPNQQEAATLWFHDHVLGITRLNVYAGLAAFYLIRDRHDTGREGEGLNLPAGPCEIEAVIQDRQFDVNGQWLFPDGSPAGLNGPPPNPDTHPFWIPEFFGDVIVVNGKSWPYLRVQPRRYRFRLLNACNARFLDLRLAEETEARPGPAFWQIGGDGGLFDRPVRLNQSGVAAGLLLAPAERADIVVDFSGFAGRTLILRNSAKAPYPSGDIPDPDSSGQVMQIRVDQPLGGTDASFDPALPAATLRGGRQQPPAIVRLADAVRGAVAAGVRIARRRQLVLVEAEDAGGSLGVLINNTKWSGKREASAVPIPGSTKDGQGNWLSELPRIGATEVWEIVNLTDDAHPMHLHLVQFQLINRQRIAEDGYRAKWSAAFPGGKFIAGYGPPLRYDRPNSDGALGGNPALAAFLRGPTRPPDANEAGWKDTIRVPPAEVTRIVVRWAPQDIAIAASTAGVNHYPFDPMTGPGYVWHCHILDHEDNEMMRPYAPIAGG